MKQIGTTYCATIFRNYQEILPLGKRPREKNLKSTTKTPKFTLKTLDCHQQKQLNLCKTVIQVTTQRR